MGIIPLAVNKYESPYTIMWLRQWNQTLTQHDTMDYVELSNTNINILELEEIELSTLEVAWSQELPQKKRHQYSRNRRLMRQLLAPIFNCSPAQVPLHSPPGKRPYLNDNSGYISLSHSRNGFLLGWSVYPIGVDLESIKRSLNAYKVQKRFFPIEEQKMLKYLEGEVLRKAVLRSWVSKEAAIKLQGKSLSMELRHWYLDTKSGQLKQLFDGSTPKCLIVERQGWICSLASNESMLVYWH